jgi:hypothetical protein
VQRPARCRRSGRASSPGLRSVRPPC